MKKISLLFIFICLFFINVKADMEPPVIVDHKVMVTNKNGAICYENGKKSDKVIPYKTILEVGYDIHGSYIDVTNDTYNCTVKYSDVSAITQEFNVENNNSDYVKKITPVKAIILPSGGVNLRKGPSVTYAKIITVPQYSVVTLTHQAGTYWYYTAYSDKQGWITSINYYVGIEGDKVLISPAAVKIYDTKTDKVIGTIPANQDITNYLILVNRTYDEPNYYVIYNGIKGYIKDDLYNKIDDIGKIKLTKDYELRDVNGNPIKKLTTGRELEFTMRMFTNYYYFPELKQSIYLDNIEFEYIKNPKDIIKENGYLGEGLFGEEKMERIITPEATNNESYPIDPDKENQENGLATRDIIIICLLGGIFLAITALVIIKLVNSKKNNIRNHMEIEKAREIINNRINKEGNQTLLKRELDNTNHDNKEV